MQQSHHLIHRQAAKSEKPYATVPLCHCVTASLRQDTSTHPSQQRSGTVAQWHKLHCDFSCKFLKKNGGKVLFRISFFRTFVS